MSLRLHVPRRSAPATNRSCRGLRAALSFGLAVALCVAVASPARAQEGRRPFFTVGSLAGFEYRSMTEPGEPWGVTPEVSLGLGAPLHGHLDLRVETSIASTLKNEYTEQVNGLMFHQQLNTHVTLGSVLLGCGLRPYGPLEIRFLIGGGIVSRRLHYEIDSFEAPGVTDSRLVSPVTSGNHLDTSTRGVVASVGFDAEFAVSSRVRMVPQVRAHVFDNAWRFDPGMSVRVAF